MFSKKFYIILSIMVVAGLGIFYALQAGFYPAAIVSSSLISARSLDEAVLAADHYLSQANTEYLKEDRRAQSPIFKELRRAALDKMIENEIVYNELAEQAIGDLDDLVNKKVNTEKVSTAEFEKAVATVYGLTIKKYKELELIPQARLEILSDKLKEKNADFEEWLKAERKKISVLILAPDLKWDGEKVVLK